MDNKETLRTIAIEINDLLSEYITIHNKVLKKAMTFLSLFRRINYKGLHYNTKILLSRFKTKQDEIIKQKSNLYSELPQRQKDFFDCISEYINALTISVEFLSNHVELLYKRSHRVISLKFKEYKAVLEQYEQSISNYRKIGERLNILYKKL